MPAGVANVEERDKMLRAIEAMKRYNAKIFYTDKEIERRFLAKKVKEARKKQYEQKIMAALSQQLEQNQTLPKDIPKRYKELLREYLNEHNKAIPDELNIVHGPNDPLYGLIDTQQGAVTTEPFPARTTTYTPRPADYTEARDIYQQMGPRDFIVVRRDDPYFVELAKQIRAHNGKILQITPGVFALNKKTAPLLPSLMLRSPALRTAAPYPPPVHKTLPGKTAEETYRTIGRQVVRDNPLMKFNGLDSYSDIIEDLDNLDADERVTELDDSMRADDEPDDMAVDPDVFGEQVGEYEAQTQQNTADHQAAMAQVFDPKAPNNFNNGYVPLPHSGEDLFHLMRLFGVTDFSADDIAKRYNKEDISEVMHWFKAGDGDSPSLEDLWREAMDTMDDKRLPYKCDDNGLYWVPITPELKKDHAVSGLIKAVWQFITQSFATMTNELAYAITGKPVNEVIADYDRAMRRVMGDDLTPYSSGTSTPEEGEYVDANGQGEIVFDHIADDTGSLNASGMINHFGKRLYLHNRVKPFVKFNPFDSPEVMVKEQERKNELMREKFRTEHKHVYGVDPSNDTVSTAIPTLAKPFNPRHVHLVFRPVQPPKSHYSFLYGKI